MYAIEVDMLVAATGIARMTNEVGMPALTGVLLVAYGTGLRICWGCPGIVLALSRFGTSIATRIWAIGPPEPFPLAPIIELRRESIGIKPSICEFL